MTNKKILILISFMLFSLMTFVGCSLGFGNDQDKIKIEIKGDTEITLYTDPENDSQEKATTITVSVTGVDKEVQKGVTYTIENEDVVGLTLGSADRDGNTDVVLTAKHGGSTTIKFMSVYGDKNVTVLVNVVERLTSMNVAPNYSNTVFTNSVNALEPMSIISFEPSTTSQKDVKFELYSEYENIEIAERDGTYVLNVGECGTQVIKIKATAMEGNQVIKNIPSVIFEVKVIEKLTAETVTVNNVTLSDVISYVNGGYETLELTSNSAINSPKRTNNLNISIEPKNQTDAKFVIEEKNYGSLDREIVETTKIGDSDSFEYEVRGIGSGSTSIYYVITIEGFEGYHYDINIPVNVVELPSVVSVNGNNVDFSGKLYTVYDTWGMKFEVIVGSSNAYDHRYEVRVDPSVVTLYNSLGNVIPLMDIDGETIRKTNPINAETVSTIYAVANVEAAEKNISSAISFIAYVTANSVDNVVQTNYNFTVSQGVREITLEEFTNNTIYVEKGGKAYLNYVLEPSSDSDSGEQIVYDESQISYKILTTGGENYITLEKTEESGQFLINGLENTEKVSVSVISANGVSSDPVYISVYTPGTFVAVSLPSASTNSNILVTNYSGIAYGFGGIYSVNSLTEPFNSIEYVDGVPTVTLQDGENIDAPVFGAVVATNTTTKFELENDPSNEDQTVVSRSFKFVVPEKTNGSVIKFRDINAKTDPIKAQVTSGGYLQTMQEGTIYVLIETKFLAAGEYNGTVKNKSYYRLIAINSYPKITSVTLRSLGEDVVYNKAGLGEIDVMTSEFKTYNFTRLTIGPEAALNREILRKETTNLEWNITGVPGDVKVNYVIASDYNEFNTDKTQKIADIEGITIVYDDSQGGYGFSDSEEVIYTRAYVFFNFDDSYFGTRNSMIFNLSIQLTQFNSNYVKSVLVTVKRPVVAQSLDINYVATNVSNGYNRIMTKINPYSYELYIDSRDGLNLYDDVKNLTVKNRNLTNSFALTATLHPSNITNSKLNYILCDSDGTKIAESNIIKVLEDGTIVPLSSGVAYVRLSPVSADLANEYTIVVRVANGESWETAYKIYNQADLLAIEGTEETREYLKKYYELANDIYMNKAITPLGVFDDEVIAFSGGLRGFDSTTGHIYKIYNLELRAKTVTTGDKTQTYTGLFGRVTGEVMDIQLDVAGADINITSAGDNYIGIVAGRTSDTAILGGIVADIQNVNISTTQTAYIGGVVGYSEGTLEDVAATYVNGGANSVTVRTRVTGTINVYVQTSAVTNIGGIAGYNAGTIKSDFNYFEGQENFNNADDNAELIINVNSIATTKLGNVGSIAGENTGLISGLSSVATVIANTENAGGIAGINKGTITGCYFAGQVRGADNVGGIAGKVDVNETSTTCTEAVITMSITEIFDTTVTKTTNITVSRIMGNKNVGGLVGYIDFSVPSQNHVYTTGYHTIDYSYVRSYLPTNAYSDISLTGATGNLGGLVGYAKNVNITNSYAETNIIIDKMTEGLNVGGLVGKLENNVFTARKTSGSYSFADNVKVQDVFAVGTIMIKDAEETELTVGQLIGLVDLNLTPVQQIGVTERVYTNVKTSAVYNPLFKLGLIGTAKNVTNTYSNLFRESYYVYDEESDTPYVIGKPATTFALTDTTVTFASWQNFGTTWKVLNGLNNEMMVIYKNVDGEYLPIYTIIPTNIDLNIKNYNEDSQLFTRIDSASTSTDITDNDQVSKSAVLYIYEGETNEYNIKDVVNVQTVPSKLNSERYYVVSDNENIVKVVGNKIYPVGEGTAIITICSAYSKETVYDCIQFAVVYHNFEMRFLDGDLKEYGEDDIIRISKSGSEQIIVYTDDNSGVNGVKVVGNIYADDENAITVNEKVLGSDIIFNTNSGAVYSNLLSIKENNYYNETTYIVLKTIPYFNVSLYTNPKSPTQETFGQKTIYNSEDAKNVNLLVYVGATEISFNTNDVKSSIGSEISVTVTLKTDYQEDTLLVFINDELKIDDNSYDVNIQTDDWQISYFASTKNVATYYDAFQGREVFSGYITYEFKINASDEYVGSYDSNDLKVLYETIRASVTFAGKSSYLGESASADIEDYPVKNTFNFRITPAIVSSINIQNYSAGRTTSGKYDPSEDPSTSIVPGEIGLLDILVTPVYAGITKITLENEFTNYTKISLLQVLQEEETGLYVQTNDLIKNTDGGIELNLKSSIDSEGNVKYDGHIYVRTLIASEIPYDIDLTLVVTAIFEEDGTVTSKVQTITLKTAEAAGLKMDINGNNYAYIVKGTSLTPRTRVLGFTNKAVYKLATIEPTYENFVHYFDSAFVSTITRENITDEEIETLFNDQLRVNSATGEVYVGVLIKKGVVLTLEGSVTEYMNNGIKIGSASINLYVVDYLITGLKVQNAVNDTIMAVCNIPKTLKVDLAVDRCTFEEYNYKYRDLEDVISASIYRNVVKSVENFFGVNTDYKSNIDVEIENLLNSINTYEEGIWLYTPDAMGSSNKRYSQIVIGEYYNDLFEVQRVEFSRGSGEYCYAIRLKEEATLSFKARANISFNFDSTTGEVIYTFNPLADEEILGDDVIFEVDFNVKGINSTSVDNPLPIYDKDKFIEYLFGTQDTHYILLTDITLDNWTARDTSVASFDGNGYTITINSFADARDDISFVGLFKSISADTLMTNVKVQYKGDVEIKNTMGLVNELNVGLFAYENNGTLFNCSVIVDGETNIEVNTDAEKVHNGLFVTKNNSTGSITNSHVGSIDGTQDIGSVLHYASKGEIGGFAEVNEGHIASSFAKNISLKRKDATESDDESGVAGFVVKNTSKGEIYFSYVEGIRGNNQKDTQIQLSELGYKNYNTGIYSPGRVAGFAYINNGYIQDAYANIPLISPTSSTGFVYSNGTGAVIKNAYSACLQPTSLDDTDEYSNTSHSQFTGINDLNEILNSGEIVYAYYYNSLYDENIYAQLGEPALAIPADAFKNSIDEFGNFIGGDNMIWQPGTLAPQLVSPNRIIRRQRFLLNNLTGNEDVETLEQYVYYYEDKVDGEFDYYGSYSNPIIIASGMDFVHMSDVERLTPYTNSATGETITTTLNQNDYIVIKDVDLSTVIDSGLENLQSVTFAGMLEGNGYVFDNVSIVSEKSNRLSGVSFGMFEQIGALVLFDKDVLVTVDSTSYHCQIKNLTINIDTISGTHATAVGTLAGVIVNADIVNINISAISSGENVTVQGERYVGAVAGYIAGKTQLINIESNISVSSEFRNEGTDINKINPYFMDNIILTNSVNAYKFNIDTTNFTGGFAGGIAGLVDCFTLKIVKSGNSVYASLSRNDYDKIGYNYVSVNFVPQINSVTVSGEVSIIGDVVGGIIGLNNQGTSVYNARFQLEKGNVQKISGEIIAGGLIGMNYGKIDQSAIAHRQDIQDEIDEGIITVSELNSELFYESNKYPVYIGGLVGYDYGIGNSSGIITNCYSRADVINYNAEYAGGMVGYMTNGYLQYCYTSANVVSNYQRIDESTGNMIGSNRTAAGAVGYLASFVSKSAVRYFTEYTGLSYYSLYGLVCANNWDNENINKATTAALIGYVSGNVKLEDNVINGVMEIFVNNLEETLSDILYYASTDDSYNITINSESLKRSITSYSYDAFKEYHKDGAVTDAQTLYESWDKSIWDVKTPYFPLLLLHRNAEQSYITNEEELRSIGTDGFYILENDIYLTEDWIPIDGFEGTLTSKKKKDGTYCTIYNININGKCYDSDDEDASDTIGNVGFFSSVKDKAYIYNINFVIGGNIMLPENYDTLYDGTPIHEQRTEWKNYQGKTGYTHDSGLTGEISYEEAFVNGIRNHVDFNQIIKNNSKDMQEGFFTNSYGTGALAGVITNATVSNVTVSYGQYTRYALDGHTAYAERATIESNTPYIGGFAGYAQNTKFTNCQVSENPINTYIKDKFNGQNIFIEGSATINAYNNEYIETINDESIKSIVSDYDGSSDNIARVILEFYQQPQCVGGFVGKLDADSTYIRFNARDVKAHINIHEKYNAGRGYYLPSMTLYVGGLIGHANVAAIDTVNVYATIVSAVNSIGVNLNGTNLPSSDNKTELCIGGIIGVSDKSVYTSCVFKGTIKLVDSKKSSKSSGAVAQSVVNIGGIIGKIRSDVTTYYCVAIGYDSFAQTSGYSDYKDPVIIDINNKIDYLYIGGIIGNALTVSAKIKKSLFSGNIDLIGGNTNNLCVGGILGNLDSNNSLSNQATIQSSYSIGTINVQTNVNSQAIIGGLVGVAKRASLVGDASTMEIINLGSTIDKNAPVYAGNLAGILGFSTGVNAAVSDCFTSGAIRINRANLNGAIGGFVGAMYGNVKTSYTATTITSISDNNPVTVEHNDGEKKYVSEDGIIGPMFGYSSAVLQTSKTVTAFYVFDYTGCVMRSVDADITRYGKQIAISDIAKECVYGTADSIMSVFASSASASWKTMSYGPYFESARNTYSLPILTYMESDTFLIKFCKFSEILSNGRIDILMEAPEGEDSYNQQAQQYELYYGSKLYPYVLKSMEGVTFNDFRNRVMEGRDVENGYFAISSDFDLDGNSIGFDNINFNLIGHGNAININTEKLFANTLNKERLITSINFVSSKSILGTNNGLIYNSVISGHQEFDYIQGYESSFIKVNNGLVVNCGIISKVSIKQMESGAKFGLFAAYNSASGIINSCFATGTIYLDKEYTLTGDVAGFVNTVAEKSHIMNIISATSINVVNDDKLDYKMNIKAFVSTFEGDDLSMDRVFVDKLSVGYKNAYDYNVKTGDKKNVDAKIYLVTTSYLVDNNDEGATTSGNDDLKVLLGAKKTLNETDINLKYALAGRNSNYDYYMAYNYGYPFPALIAYYQGSSLMNALSTGNGTEIEPYLIPHAGKVDWIRTMLVESASKSFSISNDIYMNVFESFEPLLNSSAGKFDKKNAQYERNTFDYFANLAYVSSHSNKPFTLNGYYGGQHTIYYLSQDITTDAGLFESLQKGQDVYNIAIAYADITTTGARAGVLAGSIKNGSIVKNVGVYNSIITFNDQMASNLSVGGMAGYVENVDSLTKCSAEAQINIPATNNTVNIGGLVGYARNVKKFDYCYSGSTINILDGSVESISKTNIGGIVGYNFNEVNGGTTFDSCLILTSVNYSGLVGYRYNLSNYGTEQKIAGQELQNRDQITTFANIGNIVGVSNRNADTLIVDRINVVNCSFNEDITMVANTCVVGNDYGQYSDKLVAATYRSFVSKLNTSGYASIGARLGSKANAFEIDGSNVTLQDFGATGKFITFGILTSGSNNISVSGEGTDLSYKFLYGNNAYLVAGGNVINKSVCSIISAIKLTGSSTGSTQVKVGEKASGGLCNYGINTLIKKIESQVELNSDEKYVGGILGKGEASLVMDSKARSNIISTYNRAIVGGIAGMIERGGYWFCSGVTDRITAEGRYAVCGGIAGEVPEVNAFIVSCDMSSGNITSSLTAGVAGGLVGELKGLIAYGQVGISSKIYLQGYYAGGLIGKVRSGADNIFLNGYHINVAINSSVIGGGVVSELIGKGFVVKNTTVDGNIAGTGSIGGIAGLSREATIGVDKNNKNTVNVSLIGNGDNIGGIAGTSIMSNISFNEFKGKITQSGRSNVGGIVGTATSSKIMSNIVIGTDTNNIRGYNNVGGIVGYVKTIQDDDDISGTTVISGNTSSIVIEGSGSNIGGIVGYVNQVNTSVSGNIHTNNIKGYTNVGGIVGATGLPVDTQNGTVATIVQNHHKSGSVTATYDVAGGITGYMASSTSRENIVGEDEAIKVTGTTAGGVVGKVSVSIDTEGSNETSTINKDTLSNKDHVIEAVDNAGGILGYSNSYVSIVSITMYAKTISGTNAGGVVGYGERARISSWSAIKYGLVTGTNAGGLIGSAKSATFATTNLPSDIGEIKGKNVGGYAGVAVSVSLQGKDKEYISLTRLTDEEITAKKTNGLKLTAITENGSIGSVFGESERCSIKFITTNLILEGKSSNMGGLIGKMKSTSIENCISDVKFNGTAKNLGGIAGMADESSANPVSSCIYKGGDLGHTATNVGGIIGYAKGVSLTKNSITADIKITASGNGNAGGIAGYAEASTVKNEVTVIVKVKEVSAVGGNAGGIAGYIKNASVTDFTITSLNLVKGKSAGGAVGRAESNGAADTTIANIAYSTQMQLEGDNIGGLVGYANGNGAKVNVKNSTIKLKTLSGSSSSNVGGFVGNANYVEVAACKIIANTIEGSTETYGYTMSGGSVGGIFGYATNSSVTGSEVSTVKITSAENGGGVVGYAKSMGDINAPKILKVDITAKNSGGIAGYVEGGGRQITGIKVYGTVNGSKNTGGVAGYAKNSKITNVDLTNVVVNSTGGESAGTICGTAEECEISNMTIKTDTTIKNAKYGSAGVGKLIKGTMNVKVASSFKFNATAQKNGSYGAFAGYSTGSITATIVGGGALRATVSVSNEAKYVGAIVGENRDGAIFECRTTAVGVNVQAKNSEFVGGMFGFNNGTARGPFAFYFQVTSDHIASGYYADGNADLPGDIKIYIHKYTSGSNSANNALGYANARSNGGSASNYFGGDVWGSGPKYSVYPHENFAYDNLPSSVFVLTEDCRNLTTPSMSNATNAVKSAPAYLKEKSSEVYLQCTVNSTPTVTYYYDNWRYNFLCTNDGQMMSSIDLAAETYYKNASKKVSKRELVADMMTCDIKWAAYNNFKGSTTEFNRNFSGVSYSDIGNALNEAYGYKLTEKTYTSWSELKSDIKSEAKGYTFSINDENLMKKWTTFWNTCHANWSDDYIFKSESQLKNILNAGTYGYYYGSGVDQQAHDNFKTFLLQQTKKFGNSSHSLVTESTFGNPATGGVICWYPNQESYINSIKSLEQMYNDKNVKFTDNETHKVVLDTIKILGRGKIDDNKNKEFDLNVLFDVCVDYTYGVGVSPLSGAPGVFKFAGSSGEYPVFKQGGRSWSADRMAPGSGTIGSVGCLITSITCCIASTGLAPNINPGILNQWIVQNHGYVNGSNFVWASTNNAKWSGTYQGQSYSYDLTGWRCVNSNVIYNPSKVQDLFNQGYRIVIEVYHPDQNGQHWLAITNVSNGGNLVSLMDPGWGDNIELPTSRRYGGRLPYKYTYFDWPGRAG